MKNLFILTITCSVLLIACLGIIAWAPHLNPLAHLLGPGRISFGSGVAKINLEDLNELATLKVRIGWIMQGKNNWYKAAWTVEGDAVISADLKSAESKVDESNKVIDLTLNSPRVISASVDHKTTKLYDLSSNTWNPARFILGDPDSLRDEAMEFAQTKIAEKASTTDYIDRAKSNTEKNLGSIYRQFGYDLKISWRGDM